VGGGEAHGLVQVDLRPGQLGLPQAVRVEAGAAQVGVLQAGPQQPGACGA